MDMQEHGSQNFSIPNHKTDNGSLRDILHVFFRRKKAFLLLFGGIFLSVVLFTYISPEIYQSEAKVLIRVGRESLSLDPTVDGPTVSLSQSRENEVNSELAIIKSKLLAEQVVDKITPETFLAMGKSDSDSEAKSNFLYASTSFIKDTWRNAIKDENSSSGSAREEAINRMINNLGVEVEQKSHVINILFEAPEAQFSQKVLNTFLELYQDHHIQVHRTQASPQFFQEQVEKLFVKLKEKENELEAFRASNHIASIDIQKEKLFTRISALKGEIAEINSQIAASKAHNASLEQGLLGRSREVELGRVAGRKSNTSDAIKARLFDFRIKEADLSARYPDNHRELLEVREQIKVAEEALRKEKQTDEITTGIDPTYQAMQLALETGRAELQAQIARQNALKADIKKPQEELATLVKNEITESRLKRDVSLLEEDYLQYRQDFQRTNISQALDIGKVSNLSIIQPATMPMEPIKPQKAINLALGFLLALFGAITFVFFREYLDDSLKTKEDVEKRLGLPVLASVPCEESRLCI